MSVRHVIRAFSALCVALGLAGAASAQVADTDHILVGRIEGVINPVTARYVDRIVSDGEERRVRAVVFVIDTPGGTLEATSRITRRMLNANVPVITYVARAGSRAAPAGTFITLAGHVAGMAPSTNVAAAHPVGSGGENIERDLRAKAENDAVAQIRNIATARGRNADWAEDAVRKSVSITADEAVSLKVVDTIATDLADLLRKADGRQVTLSRGPVKLATASAAVEDHPFSPLERFLHLITDPSIAILLFPLGRPTLPGIQLTIPPLTIAAIAGGSALFFVLLARASYGFLRLPTATGSSLLVGSVGVAKSDVDPAGIVHVAGEDWTATSEAGPIRQGEPVSVSKVDGIRLVVTRAGAGAPEREA